MPMTRLFPPTRSDAENIALMYKARRRIDMMGQSDKRDRTFGYWVRAPEDYAEPMLPFVSMEAAIHRIVLLDPIPRSEDGCLIIRVAGKVILEVPLVLLDMYSRAPGASKLAEWLLEAKSPVEETEWQDFLVRYRADAGERFQPAPLGYKLTIPILVERGVSFEVNGLPLDARVALLGLGKRDAR